MPTVVNGFDELKALVNVELEPSGWLDVNQDRVNTFAAATDDYQWVHVDVARAKSGPFGGTIAHGYLTLSLIIPLWTEMLHVRGVAMKINYGLNRVRFPAPVPVGSKVRLHARFVSVEDVSGGVQLTVDHKLERQGGDRPVLVAEALYRFMPERRPASEDLAELG